MLTDAIETVQNGGRPMMALDLDSAAKVRGPATMDGIGPTNGWETFWAEVDHRRRTNALWSAAVPPNGSKPV
jgi:hypothetical protein